MPNVLATLMTELRPAAIEQAEADKPALKAALPFALRIFSFGGIWGWVIGTVLDCLLSRGWRLFAAWIRKQTVGDILDTLDAVAGVVGAGPSSIEVVRHHNETHDEWEVYGPYFAATFSSEADARDFAKLKEHNNACQSRVPIPTS